MRLTMCARCGPVMSSRSARSRACASAVSQVAALVSVLTVALLGLGELSMLGGGPAREDLAGDRATGGGDRHRPGQGAAAVGTDRRHEAADLDVITVPCLQQALDGLARVLDHLKPDDH